MKFFAVIFALASFVLANEQASSVYKDNRDGKSYATIQIGTQTWFAENLQFDAKGSFCYGGTSSCSEKGRLYPWTVAQNACPEGTRLPSNDDFHALYAYVGVNGVRSVGNALKSKSGWVNKANGFDDYGFRGVPAGICEKRGKCDQEEGFLSLWTSTSAAEGKRGSQEAVAWNLYWMDEDFNKSEYEKNFALSVRCILNTK